MFCPTCGSILKTTVCSCGFILKKEDQGTVHNERYPEKKTLGIADEENPLATIQHTCKKCGYGLAELASKGIFYSDEDENAMFVCGKCGHQEEVEGHKIK